MSDKLYNAMQQSFIEGAQLSLAAMNEEDYYLIDTYTREKIIYGQTFFLFRGRVFASKENWKKWLIEQSSLQQECINLPKDPDRYTEVWKKYRKIRAKTLTNDEE